MRLRALLSVFIAPSRDATAFRCAVKYCYRDLPRRPEFLPLSIVMSRSVTAIYRAVKPLIAPSSSVTAFIASPIEERFPRAVSDRVTYCVVENSFRCLLYLPELLPLSIEPSSTATAISSAVQHLSLSLLRCRERLPLLIAPPIEQLFQELFLLFLMPSSFSLRRREVLPPFIAPNTEERVQELSPLAP